jgi:AbrB family looped-hinge helix DNA binding protein
MSLAKVRDMIFRTRVETTGRIVIPGNMRERLGMKIGETVYLRETENSIEVTTSRAALRRIQNSLKGRIPEEMSVVDELIVDRRQAAEYE